MDIANWKAYKAVESRMEEQPENIEATSEGLKLSGFHLGGNAQYSLASSVANEFKDELITMKMIFDGEFVSPDASFIFLALRGTSESTIFWSQQCYAFLFKGTKIEVQKHGRGTNPNHQLNYSEFSELGFDKFPVGEEVEIKYGVINNGRIPEWVLYINGVEIFRGPDNRYGQRVNYNPNMLLQVGMCATNKEVLGDNTSRSSLLITSIE
ncbi:MAG: hypothetical protein JXR86_03040 [Spirochaetales bacterium]|nr:hypothetical protein [Spirochaetales bacterium]